MKLTYRRFAGTAFLFLILSLLVGPTIAAGGALGYAIVQRRAKTAGLKKPFYYRIANVGFGILGLFGLYELLLLIAQGRSGTVDRWLNATQGATIAVEQLFARDE